MKIKYLTLIILATLIFGNFFVSANENFTEAEKLIGEKVSCDNLSEEQLEEIGDYYMEQMHPGESHEYMDKMMGGEGSESLRAMHIQMARSIYCDEEGMMNMMSNGAMSSSMMNKMGSGMMGGNMMTGGIMGNNDMMNYRNVYGNNIYGLGVFSVIFNVLILFTLTLVIVLLTKQLIKK